MRFLDLVKGEYRSITLLNIAVAAGGGAMYYLTSGFLPTMLDSVVGMPSGPARRGAAREQPGRRDRIGHRRRGQQRYGRRRTMLTLGAVNIVALPILTLFISRSEPGSTTRIMLAACLLAFLANAAYSPVMIFLNERYPTAIRSRGTAVSWNTGFMLGGLLPTFVNLLSPTVSDIPGRLAAFIIAPQRSSSQPCCGAPKHAAGSTRLP